MIGRTNEAKELNRLYARNRAELVAIYGRRRVGKTYLVDETFADRITFRHAGLSLAAESSKGLLKLQQDHFCSSLALQGMEKCKKPTTWLDAFLLLEKFLQRKDDGSRQLVFLDELSAPLPKNSCTVFNDLLSYRTGKLVMLANQNFPFSISFAKNSANILFLLQRPCYSFYSTK